jgi:hypothetical protein
MVKIESSISIQEKRRGKQRTGEESPCTDIELIGKL